MEWLGLLLLFGFTVFLLGRRHTKRIDRLEAENAAKMAEVARIEGRHQ